MFRFLSVLLVFGSLGFAPVPTPRSVTDPDRAIVQFDRTLRFCSACGEQGLDRRKTRLMDRLRDLENKYRLQGDTFQASEIHSRLLLVENLSVERPLGPTGPTALFQKASLEGKYRDLMYILHVPNDQTCSQPFHDFGYWNGTHYAGRADLKPGHWVYIQPRWFVWREGPPRQ